MKLLFIRQPSSQTHCEIHLLDAKIPTQGDKHKKLLEMQSKLKISKPTLIKFSS